MKTFSKQKIIEFLVILAIGLIPLLWFQGDKIVLGHDAGLTLSPITHFQDRLHAWTYRFGYGGDQTYAISGFFIHGLEALISALNVNVQTVQKITFIFWFVLPGLTMFYLATYLEKKLRISHFVIPVSVLYMINHFLLQGWFVAERTKFSLYAALPLILGFLFKWQDRSISTVKTGLLISITLFFLNGMASLPLFGGMIIVLVVFAVFHLFEDSSFNAIKRLGKLIITTTLVSLFLNAYWLVPYASHLTSSFSNSVEFFGGLGGVLEWLNYLSQNSSFANIFTLQGIPEWYQNPDHPYAGVFLNNPILITVASVIPILAVLPLIVEKDPKSKKIIVFFMIVALVSMIFIAGSHPPFGLLYTLLFKYFPGFIVFRSPFYKFSPALIISYAVLIGYSFQYIRLVISQKNSQLGKGIYLSLITIVLLYSYPFLSGSFFDYIKNTRSMRVSVPQYIYDFEKWVGQKENTKNRILVFPPPNIDNKVDAYKWGYWSLAPLTTLLANNQIINESGYMSQNELTMTRKLYQLIDENDPSWIKLAQFLGIDTFLIRYDFAWDIKSSPTKNPKDYDQFLRSANLQKVKEFGEWHVYKIVPESSESDVSVFNSIALFKGEDISSITSLSVFDPQQALYIDDGPTKISYKIKDAISSIYIKPDCVMCDQQWTYTNYDNYTPLLRRGSVLYPIIKFQEAQSEKKVSRNPEALLKFYAEKSLSEILGFRKAVDENEPPQLLEGILGDHFNQLNKYKSATQNYIRNYQFDNENLLDIARLARAQRLVILEEIASAPKTWNSNTEPVIAALQKNFFEVNSIQSELEQAVWRSPDNFQKRFFVNLPSTADYTLLYRPNVNLDQNLPINISIDGVINTINPQRAPSGWLNLGNLKINEGNRKIEVVQPLVNEYRGDTQVKIQSTYQGNCYELGKIQGKKDDKYRLTFQYLRLNGRKDFSADFVNAMNSLNQFRGIETLNRESFEDQFIHDFIVTDKKEDTFIICNRPGAEDTLMQSTILVKDIVIAKLNVPELVLYSQKRPPSQTVRISDTKSSQAGYSVSLDGESNNQVLVLDQSFNENWKATTDAIKFKANGYANGWLLTENEKTFTVEYSTESLVRIGFVISGLSLLISLGYMLKSKKYEN